VLLQVYLETLSELQDRLPSFPNEIAWAVVEEELGVPVAEVYEQLSEQPVAAASLGQVSQHMHTVPDGRVAAAAAASAASAVAACRAASVRPHQLQAKCCVKQNLYGCGWFGSGDSSRVQVPDAAETVPRQLQESISQMGYALLRARTD
jgi:hypothetical protein